MIVPYTGQPLEPGAIVCRRSIMTTGFASRPVTIVRVTGSRAVVRDSDGDERRIDLSTIRFVVDTMEEGMALHRANIEFMEREREIEVRHNAERGARRRVAIEAIIDSAREGAL